MKIFDPRAVGLSLLLLNRDLDKCVFRASQPLDPIHRNTVLKRISRAHDACSNAALSSAAKQIGIVLFHLRVQGDAVDYSTLASELRHAIYAILDDLNSRLFVEISGETKELVNSGQPFGEVVNQAFPSAVEDIKEAGRCIALGCNTAAVFHLMRAAEVGLWELGRDRQIPLARSEKIEFSEWGLIIAELEGAVKAIQQWPNSSIKESAHKFYNHAVVEIRAFNDGWRRHSAHPRPDMPPMSADEARASWGHVERFMKKLATKISEGKYTELVWNRENAAQT